jgi:hypothetical protein
VFIRARPEFYVESHYLINTDQVALAWDSVDGLALGFSNKKTIIFPDLDLNKFEDILINNHRDAIVNTIGLSTNEVVE